MIYLKFTHTRDIFKGKDFQGWVEDWFPEGCRFNGTEYGNHYPEIEVSLRDFENWKAHEMECQKQKARLIAIEYKPDTLNIIQFLVHTVKPFKNDLREMPEGRRLLKKYKKEIE